MGDTQLERCSTSLIFREIQIKTTVEYYDTSTRIAVIKKALPGVGKDAERLEPSYTAVAKIK